MAARATTERQILQVASEEEVHQVLSRVLNSKHFIHAPKKQKFIRLICDFYLNGRAGELNEYLIGREVFDRDEDYNPSADPIVRVGAHDIRKKLELYYQHEGANDEIKLGITIGSYEPIFIRIHPHETKPDQIESGKSADRHTSLSEERTAPVELQFERKSTDAAIANLKKRISLLYLIIALLLAGVCLLSYFNFRQTERDAGATQPEQTRVLGPVWSPFLKSGESTLLVVSNPMVFRLINAGDSEIAVKNSIVLPPEKAAALEQVLRDNFAVRNSPPNPRLVLSLDTYTGLGEAIGAQRVTDLLRTAGKSVVIKRSRTASADDLKEHNVVLFGSVWSNEWSGKLPLVEDFHVTGQATIENHRPQPGEPREYRSKFDGSTGKLLEDYALVTVKPNISNEKTVMVLAGLRSAGTEAAAEYVTNKNHLNDLNQRLRRLTGESGSQAYFQALLKVGVENGIPTTITLAGLRQLRNTGH